MQSDLLILLAAVIAVSTLAAWLGFTGRRRYYRRYRVVALLGTVVLAPSLLFVLRRQTRAPTEIVAWGITPHPAAIAAYGLPTRDDEGGTWAFTVAAPADSIRTFYLDTLNVRGWRLTLIHPSVLLFERAGSELMVKVESGRRHPNVVFSIGPPAP